ncbi:MAG TPA: hypothetical protein VM639_00755 [Dongiaceae bacterium]|nr:hypothetical protein [Dongiaceae bacterium]
MAYDPHGKAPPQKPLIKTITLPSGLRVDEADMLSACKRLFSTPEGQTVLDFLEYKALVSPIHQENPPTEDKALYVLGRREFFDTIKKLSR